MNNKQNGHIFLQEETQEKPHTSQGIILTGDALKKFNELANDYIEGYKEIKPILDKYEEEKDKKLRKQEEKPTLEEVRNILKTYGNEDLNNCIDAAIESGNINESFLFGRNAIIEAAEIGDTLIIDILIRLGANVNSEDNNGNTPLIIASKKGYYEITKKLLYAGAQANKKNKFGQSASDLAETENIKRVIYVHLMEDYLMK